MNSIPVGVGYPGPSLRVLGSDFLNFLMVFDLIKTNNTKKINKNFWKKFKENKKGVKHENAIFFKINVT